MIKFNRRSGFTLVEMIIVIVITGIVFSMVALFIKGGIDAYFDTVRRAELSEEADAALRFIGRDLHAALPNSVTCPSNNSLRFISVRSGGRYREYPTSAGAGTPLAFGSAISTFDVIGASANSTMKDARGNNAAGSVVVGNLSYGASLCNAIAPADNIAAMTAMTGTKVTINNTTFPAACNLQTATATDDAGTAGINEDNDRGFGRFFVVDPTVVNYDCTSGLKRGVVSLASHATGAGACEFYCQAQNARVQTISLKLTLTKSGESITMLRQFHIENLP